MEVQDNISTMFCCWDAFQSLLCVIYMKNVDMSIKIEAHLDFDNDNKYLKHK